ncbi:sulfite exporter TauE/SafE family protein [Limisphaera sp. VF-2]
METSSHWALASAAFLLGLAGSLHCAGMCGPLMMALPLQGWHRGTWIASRLIYHLGRVTTYAGLGCVFGGLGRTFAAAGVQRWVCLTLGAALVLGVVWKTSRRGVLGGWSAPAWLTRGMQELLAERSLGAMYGLGLLNGFLPCGLVYVAGAAATASGSLIHAVGFMIAFGLGTLPMMLALSLLPRSLPGSWRLRWQQLVPWTVAVAGVLLMLRGLSLGIPYLSPHWDAVGGAPCCH